MTPCFKKYHLRIQLKTLLVLLAGFFFTEPVVAQTTTHSSGTGSYTVPAGVYSLQVEVWGGGGRGSQRITGTSGGFGGGGGGAYSMSIIPVTPGQTYYWGVGAGSTTNAAGGDSWFGTVSNTPGSAIVRAKGGNSLGDNVVNGASGGDANHADARGDIRYSGGNGANGSGTSYGGGGGSSGVSTGSGANGSTSNGGIAPSGGGGNGGSGRTSGQGQGAAFAGVVPGGGGGGALRTGGANGGGTYAGGAGVNGRVVIHAKTDGQAYGAAGLYAWAAPMDVTAVEVETWGGGGRGGSRNASNGRGGGGGGGAYSRRIVAVTPGQTYYINVGAGSNSTSEGGTSWFSTTPLIGGVVVSAVGGNSGANDNTTAGTGGNTSGTGDIKFTGGNGGTGSGSNSAGGGASAGTAANGGNGATPGAGSAPSGGGAGAAGHNTLSLGGNTGFAPGGGGSGARGQYGNIHGGNGADGKVTVKPAAYVPYMASGVYEWIAPQGVTRIQVEAWGAGGRGGTRTSNGVGAGGGGGAYSKGVVTVIPGNTYYINVGVGSTVAPTTAASDSWFNSSNSAPNSDNYVLAKGGSSVENNSNTGATGGLASAGYGNIIKYNGGYGYNGPNNNPNRGGGGGSSAGTGAAGNATTSGNSGTPGGNAPGGGGNGGAGRNVNSQGDGNPGFAPGGGGGGAYRSYSGTRSGGAGANGQVLITIIEADVAVTQTVNTITPVVGDEITLTITVTNYGPDPATNVNLVDMLPNGYTGTGLDTGGKGSVDFLNATWIIGTLAVDEVAQMIVTATVNPTGNYTNTATITADESDLNPGNNQSSVTVFPTNPTANLHIHKEVNNITPEVGDTITFTLTAYNSGPDDATGVTVTDLLLNGYEYDSHSGGAYDNSTHEWTISNLNQGSTATLTITAIVQDSGDYYNEALIEGEQYDPVLNNNASGIEVYPVYPPLELTLPCTGTTYDLESLIIPNLPLGAEISWHTATPATDANKYMGDLTEALVGQTYYVAFYDPIQDCYSTTAEVTIKRSCLITNPHIRQRTK